MSRRGALGTEWEGWGPTLRDSHTSSPGVRAAPGEQGGACSLTVAGTLSKSHLSVPTDATVTDAQPEGVELDPQVRPLLPRGPPAAALHPVDTLSSRPSARRAPRLASPSSGTWVALLGPQPSWSLCPQPSWLPVLFLTGWLSDAPQGLGGRSCKGTTPRSLRPCVPPRQGCTGSPFPRISRCSGDPCLTCLTLRWETCGDGD